jgi:hypothetical protein
MDCEDALGTSKDATERLVDGVAHQALGLKTVEPLEPLRRGVVHGHDEAEIGRIPETSTIVAQGPANGRLVASERSVSLADAEEFTPASVRQSLLAVGDVAHLAGSTISTPVVSRFDEEHLSALPKARPSPPRRGPVLRRQRLVPSCPRQSLAAPPGAHLRPP